MKPDHAAARIYCNDNDYFIRATDNLAAAYLDLAERHAKLLELAEAALATHGYSSSMSTLIYDMELRKFIEGERNVLL